MQQEDYVPCERMTLPHLSCKIMHILLELSKHTRTAVSDLGRFKSQYSE